MKRNLINLLFFITVLLGGFYGGIGFFTYMGGNPAIEKLSSPTFAEYWQHIDSFMAMRMRIFGPILLLSMVFTIVVLIKKRRLISIWFLIAALIIIITDAIISFSINHPLNQLIQSWDLQNLPTNVQEVKCKVTEAFYWRGATMMSSFALILSGAWAKNKTA